MEAGQLLPAFRASVSDPGRRPSDPADGLAARPAGLAEHSRGLADRFDVQFSSWAVLIGDLASPALERRPAPEKWNAREHLAHATRMHGVCAARIRVILARRAPLLPAYRAERDPTWPRWRETPAPDLVAIAAGRRAALIEAVRRLSEEDLARIGVHSRLGPLPLSAWLEFFLVHEAHHLYAIFKLVREPAV